MRKPNLPNLGRSDIDCMLTDALAWNQHGSFSRDAASGLIDIPKPDGEYLYGSKTATNLVCD